MSTAPRIGPAEIVYRNRYQMRLEDTGKTAEGSWTRNVEGRFPSVRPGPPSQPEGSHG